MAKHTFTASKNDQNRKLIKFLTSVFKDVPFSKLQKTLRSGDVKINSKRTRDGNYLLHQNDLIEVFGLQEDDLKLAKFDQKIALTSPIIYEDDNILLINKNEGVEVHGADNCLDQQVYSYLNFTQQDAFKPSHVGRLDKQTSGIIIYAKNYATLSLLNKNHKNIEKIYKFISKNPIKPDYYTVYLVKDEQNEKMKIASKNEPGALQAITKIWIQNGEYFAQLLTGKKHQIRITCSSLNAPIIGDIKYGGLKSARMYLHSFSITFTNLDQHLEYLNNKTFIAQPKHWI
ncbi:pseudouridine synthase family protein [Mycoplasma simbae]|uniref:pseudouridine synthase family protein n=1 Tax=Mycoplasma simbae TaxID=36744 RepID=UPI0004951FFE|nr:RluA family pseudouridine synthase [Mycoplasma simbae]